MSQITRRTAIEDHFPHGLTLDEDNGESVSNKISPLSPLRVLLHPLPLREVILYKNAADTWPNQIKYRTLLPFSSYKLED